MPYTLGDRTTLSGLRSCDAVIIGAGLAGLCAARTLTQAGLEVLVLEARTLEGVFGGGPGERSLLAALAIIGLGTHEITRLVAPIDVGPEQRLVGGVQLLCQRLAGPLAERLLRGRRRVRPWCLRRLLDDGGMDRLRPSPARAGRRDPMGRDGDVPGLEREAQRGCLFGGVRRAGGARRTGLSRGRE
jgi:glycine/D-amino acid oxidase-like deaminating enzyme